MFDKLKQVRISKRARRGAVLGLCLCAAAGLGMHLLPGGAPVGCTQEDLADTRAVMAVQASVSGSTDAQSGAAADKVVYLTFDDGPSATTESVLDTLKAEGVPATFFVMAADNNEEYLPLLERTVQEGHLIALHTCSHDYKSIYKSPDAYWDDLQKLREKLLPYVPADHEIKWLRFPGGSTNTVSHRYGGSDIMKKLKADAESRGFTYVDWNVCAEDSLGGHPSASDHLQQHHPRGRRQKHLRGADARHQRHEEHGRRAAGCHPLVQKCRLPIRYRGPSGKKAVTAAVAPPAVDKIRPEYEKNANFNSKKPENPS